MLSVLFYIALFLIVFIIQYFAERQKNRTLKKVLILGSFALLLLMIGLRYRVGTDYVGHINLYNGYLDRSLGEIWSGDGDIGTKLIIGTLADTHSDPKLMFWIYGFLTLLPIYIINRNHKFKNLAFSTLIFNLTIMPASLNIIRQGAAMSFALLAFDYLRNNSKILKILLCMGIAAILHTSALLLAPFLLAYYYSKKKKKNYAFFVVLLTIIISIAFSTFLRGVFKDIGFNDYLYQLKFNGAINVSLGVAIYNVVLYSYIAILAIVGHKDHNKEEKANTDVKDNLFMVISGTVFELVGTMTKYLSRVSYYFSIFQIMLIPDLLGCIKNTTTRRFMKIACIVVFIFLFVYRCYIQGYYEIIPYRSWLFLG